MTSTASTSTPHIRASASATRSCTARADLGEDAAVGDDELELGAGASVLELDAEPPAPLAQPRAVDRRDRPPTISLSAASLTRTEPPASCDEHPAQAAGQRRQPRSGLLEERRRVLAAAELVAAEDVAQHVPRRRDALDLELAQRAAARARSRGGGCRPRRSPSRSASRSAARSRVPSSTNVSTRTPGPSGGRKRSIRPGAGANPRAGSSALMRSSIACPRRGPARPPCGERVARRDPHLLAHEVDPDDRARSPDARPAGARSAR